jgi:hypothetical protein
MTTGVAGGSFLPGWWAAYAAMGAGEVALAILTVAAGNARVRCAADRLFAPAMVLQIVLLALAVRIQGLQPVSAMRAAFFPRAPLYAVVLAPLGVSVLAAAAVAVALRRSLGAVLVSTGEPGGEADLPEGAAELYGRVETLRADVTLFTCLVVGTLLALNLDASWAGGLTASVALFPAAAPGLLRFVYRRQLARYERREAGPDLVREARALAAPLGVRIDSVVVDDSPRGRAHCFIALAHGMLVVSRKLLEVTNAKEREFVIRRELAYIADDAGRSATRRWYAGAFLCPVAGIGGVALAVISDPNGNVFGLAMLGLVLLLILWLVLWLGVARDEAVHTRLRAAQAALAMTGDVESAVSAVQKYGERSADDLTDSSLFFTDPLPTMKQQTRALTAPPAEVMSRNANRDVGIPMDPW